MKSNFVGLAVSGQLIPDGIHPTGQSITADRQQDLSQKVPELLCALLDGSDLLVVVSDGAGRVKLFNPACERLSGCSAAEILGQPVWERLPPPEERETAICRLPRRPVVP
ncbi:MAG: PAS domain S-box protein [Gammaproteobacteria bacterium]